MPVKTQETKAALYNYIKDWRNVDGRWVYVPLHDPIKAKLNIGFRDLVIANALREASRLLTHVTLSSKVESLAKEYAGNVSKRLLGAWEDGDPICPPNWPFGHWPPAPQSISNEPDPIFHATAVLAGISNELPLMVRNELIGFTLQLLGETLGDKNIIAVAKDIIHSGAAMMIE